ncbi:hypothetical protein JCM8115_003281 [Rhodotorula mucilaginosa]|uniref:RRM domain-containing protein n=1 Tax=Rhodotorula mucilaginosa TaxID=5537 RepID=A0A9P6W0D9_RHOMI|nr:hypothetical protein C6P46_004705 [Rhodotorula mucilaginosa]
MDLNTFLADENTGGSWADEMDLLPTGPSAAPSFGEDGVGLGGSHLSRGGFGGGGRDGPGGFGGPPGRFDDRPQRAEVPIPSVPPFTAFVGNLSFETTEGDLEDFFGGLGVKGVRMAAPSLDGKPRGFGYVEFETVDGLKNALTATGTDLQGRSVRVSVAEAKESRFGRADEASTWERSGPLPSLPGRSGGFGAARSTGGFGSDRPGGGYEEVERDAPVRGGKFVPSAPSEPRRGFSNYGAEGGSSRAPYAEVERDAPVRGGKFVPSEPTAPRRMFSDREPSRADEGSWERKGPSGVPPRGTGFGAGSRTPSDPPAARRPLQLSARSAADSGSASSTADSASASAGASSSRASPFGAARPIDTAAKERQVDEKLAKQRAEMAAQQAARDKEREEKKAKAAAEGGPASGAAEASKSEGAWVRKGPLPPSQQRHNSRDSNKQQQQPAAAKDLPPPVPTVGEPAASATPAAQRKEGFSYSKAAGKSDGGVDAVTQGVEQAKLE